MWVIHELAQRPSPVVGRWELVASGEVLSNAIDEVDWSQPEVLLSRCPMCGGDDIDGWVRLRRSEEHVVLQPMLDETFQAPPSVFTRMGIAVVAHAVLRAHARTLPSLERIAPWTMAEALVALQLENEPLLGRPPELRVPADRIVASSRGSARDGIDALERWILTHRTSHAPVVLRPLRDTETTLWLYLDGREPGDWTPLAEVDGTLAPLFAPGLVAIAAAP